MKKINLLIVILTLISLCGCEDDHQGEKIKLNLSGEIMVYADTKDITLNTQNFKVFKFLSNKEAIYIECNRLTNFLKPDTAFLYETSKVEQLSFTITDGEYSHYFEDKDGDYIATLNPIINFSDNNRGVVYTHLHEITRLEVGATYYDLLDNIVCYKKDQLEELINKYN